MQQAALCVGGVIIPVEQRLAGLLYSTEQFFFCSVKAVESYKSVFACGKTFRVKVRNDTALDHSVVAYAFI